MTEEKQPKRKRTAKTTQQVTVVEIIPPTFPEKKKMGRPRIWNNEIQNTILGDIARGFSLREICARNEMPDITVVYDELRRSSDFASLYARAKEDSADSYVAMLIDASKGPFNDILEVQAARLKIDTLKWAAAKLKPKAWGEKIQAQLTGADGGAIKIQAVPINANEMGPEVREALRAALITATATKEEDDE